VGEINIPLKVGTVGGSLETNPSVRINHRLLGSPDASELAGIMAVVGLAQNFAALRSLATNGITQNHMNLHARSVASTAGVTEEHFETVVEGLIESGEIKVWKAQEIAKNLARQIVRPETSERESACGKIIMLGEHAVVYGRPAIALPIPLAVEAAIRKEPSSVGNGINVVIPRWGLEQKVNASTPGVAGIMANLIERMGLTDEHMTIEVFPHVPRAMGLGGSSALAVAIIRALNRTYQLALPDLEINALAFECEQAAHGQASGVDNTVATYGTPLFYQRPGDEPKFETLRLGQPLELIIGMTGKESLTAETVARVRSSWQQYPDRYETIFDQIGALTQSARATLQSGQLQELGELMNLCHGYLNALQLSTPKLEDLIHIARSNGALGAKLTGGGGGGSMVALCPDNSERVSNAMRAAGYKTLSVILD
jgi:hydroxymethylglutaryl-CoA reductase